MPLTIEAFKCFFGRPFTVRYPKEKVKTFGRFRGKLVFHPGKCIGCKKCVMSCPSVAIKFMAKGKLEFDLKTCMQCGLCVDICPSGAITWSQDFETADSDREKMVVK